VPEPRPAKRSRKLYVLWSIALTLLLALGLVCWLVVVPVWRVRSVLASHAVGRTFTRDAVDELGGKEMAVRRISLYFNVPYTSRDNRMSGAAILGHCGPTAADPLTRALKDHDGKVRAQAAASLGMLGRSATDAVGPLTQVLREDLYSRARLYAARALGNIAVADEGAISALRKALGDDEVLVRRNAAASLGNLGAAAENAAPDLRRAIEDVDPWTQRSAALSLWLITGEQEPSRSVLRKLCRSSDEDLVFVVKRDLARIEAALRKIKAAQEKK
jgi:HEAT repeat protein